MPVNYFKVVVQRGIHGVRFSGSAVMDGEPDDFDDTFLARRDIEENSIPEAIRALRGQVVTIFYANGTTCRTVLGRIAAYGWTMSSAIDENLQGVPSRSRYRIMAERTMASGSKFLAAEYDRKECQSGVWAAVGAPEQLRLWPSQPASSDLEPLTLAEMRKSPAYHQRQLRYAEFRTKEETRVIGVRAQRKLSVDEWPGPPYPRAGPLSKGPPLLADWSDFYGNSKYWSVGVGSGMPYVVGFAGSRADAFGFSSSVVAIFLGAQGATREMQHLGPEDGGPSWYDWDLIGAMALGSGLPLLLYSTSNEVGAFRPIAGRYVLDMRLRFGPA